MADKGYEKGNSSNLPRLDILAVGAFISSNEKFVGAELRGVKNFRAGRESYGDDAVGYVQVQRAKDLCFVKARVTPEHKVRSKCYAVTLVINEASGSVVSVTCHDCAASEGGCKHALALLMWVNRRSEEPSVTSIDCYWRKSKLSGVGTAVKFVKAVDLCQTRPAETTQKRTAVRREPGSFLAAVLEQGTANNSNSQLLRHFSDVQEMQKISLGSLSFWYVKEGGDIENYQDFVNFCGQHMTKEGCSDAASKTVAQYSSSLWHNLRFGRITASKIYEASRCKTVNGSLVESILGAKISDSKYMKRGRDLEGDVLKAVEKKTNRKLNRVGLVLCPDYPMLGASPDAICNNAVVEVKCPFSDSTMKNYVKNGEIAPKCLAQIQLQMWMMGKKEGLFCVASPQFEETSHVDIFPVTFNEPYTKNLVESAMEFWKRAIFPMLMKKNVL